VVADAESANIVLRSWWHNQSDVFVSIENYLGPPLKPTFLMRVSNASGFVPTSSCPVTKLGIEHWPHPIVEFQIETFFALSATDEMVCE
jgi:hypothetical protein